MPLPPHEEGALLHWSPLLDVLGPGSGFSNSHKSNKINIYDIRGVRRAAVQIARITRNGSERRMSEAWVPKFKLVFKPTLLNFQGLWSDLRASPDKVGHAHAQLVQLFSSF